jgi:methylglutaconyl-CoA hydratase
MDTPLYPHVQVAVAGSIATVTLDRPAVHNAFDAELIASLTAAFRDLGAREDLRAVVLRGAGPSFCAGADVNWMRASLGWSRGENLADATRLAALFAAINDCPLPVIARVQGAALGGGVGLVACCDLVIAAEGTRFGFTEVRLGIAPATIAPYVIAKIGPSQARALFVTGERFDAARALTIGLVHVVVPPEQLDAALEETLRQIRANGPQAMRAAKALARHVGSMPHDEATSYTIAKIADLRVGDEAQEGLRAFLEKRRAAWVEEA